MVGFRVIHNDGRHQSTPWMLVNINSGVCLRLAAGPGTVGGSTSSRLCTWSCGTRNSGPRLRPQRRRGCTLSSGQRPGCVLLLRLALLTTTCTEMQARSCASGFSLDHGMRMADRAAAKIVCIEYCQFKYTKFYSTFELICAEN